MQNLFKPEHFDSAAKLELGGKAEGLLWLEQNGFETPEWCVLTSPMVDSLLGGVKVKIQKILEQTTFQNINEQLPKLQKELEVLSVDADVEQKMISWVAEKGLSSERFAVRSSLVGEDGQDFSFAGQLKTVLGVSASELTAAVLECIKGSFSKTVLSYKLQNKIDLIDHRMSVILQKMIFAEKSGVGFSINPNTSDENEVFISAAFGDCEGLVSGASDCDTFIVKKDNGEVAKTVTQKKYFSNLAAQNPEDKLTDEKGRQPVLTNRDLEVLTSGIKSIEGLKKSPQDIEWALERDKLYFLQVRPVTSKIQKNVKVQTLVFDNSNIQESYCGLTKPLTFSLASECYRLAYNQLMTFMGFSEEEVEAHDFRHSNMLAYVDGRVYYNIRSWYEGLRFMPSFGRSKEDMETMMGVQEPVDFVEDINLTRSEKIQNFPKMVKIMIKLVTQFSKIDKTVAKFEKNFWTSYRSFQKQIENKEHNLNDLIVLHRDVTTSFLKSWAAPLVNDFFVMVYNGKVKSSLQGLNLEDVLPSLTSGEDLESIKPTLEIAAIARQIESNRLSHLLDHIQEDSWKTLRSASQDLKTRLDSFMDFYGDRCIGELKLETETFRHNKIKLLSLIKNYLNLDNERNHSEKSSEDKKLKSEIFQKIKSVKGSFFLYKFQSNLKKLKKGIRYRESMRLHRTRVVGLFREIYKKIGLQFFELGVLESAEDVFYLSHAEIENFICGKSLFKDLRDVVQIRKKDFVSYETREPLHHFSAEFPYANQYQYFDETLFGSETDFKGLGCYPGHVEAPVELMVSPDESQDLKGKILCTMRTDPGWAPLFPQVEGLLIERGSSLSHSAVVAREMGIPTVVGVEGITRRVKSGEWISLNGKTGKVKKIKKGDR